jgi:hypothetical protein
MFPRMLVCNSQAAGPQNWSGSSQTGAQSSSFSSKSGKQSAKRILRAYKTKLKPRTLLYSAFGFFEVISLGAFLLAAAACNAAIRQNYQASCSDSIGAVHEGVTKQVRALSF